MSRAPLRSKAREEGKDLKAEPKAASAANEALIKGLNDPNRVFCHFAMAKIYDNGCVDIRFGNAKNQSVAMLRDITLKQSERSLDGVYAAAPLLVLDECQELRKAFPQHQIIALNPILKSNYGIDPKANPDGWPSPYQIAWNLGGDYSVVPPIGCYYMSWREAEFELECGGLRWIYTQIMIKRPELRLAATDIRLAVPDNPAPSRDYERWKEFNENHRRGPGGGGRFGRPPAPGGFHVRGLDG